MLDEVASAVAFDHRWSRFVDRLLADPAVEHALLLATAGGVSLDHLRLVALAFDQNWDLADRARPGRADEVPPWTADLARCSTRPTPWWPRAPTAATTTTSSSPTSTALAQWVAARARRQRRVHPALAAGAATAGAPTPASVGQKGNWPCVRPRRPPRAGCAELTTGLDDLRGRVLLQAVQRLAVDLRRFTLESADERRVAGELEFHDLLVLSRQMLRDPTHGPGVRAALAPPLPPPAHRRVPGHRPHPDRARGPHRRHRATPPAATWDAIDTRPGHLFFVGDPKQSIYRFRRADISLFLRAAERFGAGDRGVALTTNFRTGAGVIDVVNHVFGALIVEKVHDGLPSQPPYVPFVPVRPDAPVGPPVAVLGADAHDDTPNAAEVRRREAADVAEAVRRVVAEGWLVDRAPHGPTPDWQPARLGDITILVPTRTSLPALEDALVAGRHLLPGRVGLARLRQPPGARPAAHAAGHRRPHRRAGGRRRPALAAVRLRRRRPLPVPARPPRPASTTAGRSPTVPTTTTPSSPGSPTCAPCTTSVAGCRPASSPIGSCATAGCSSWARPTAGPATCGGACASSSTRRGRGPTPPTARSVSTWRGSASRPPRAAGCPRPCCPRPTTTPCAS